MKRIFFVAIAATLLAAGCQKTEIVNHVGGDAMTFTTNMNKLTKADADNSGMENLQEQNFRVWAYYVAANEQTGAEANALYDGMGNAPVSYDETTEKWGTDKQYYWPGTGKALNFFAVSADAATHGTANDPESGKITINDDRTELTITGFVVDHNSPNTDLMVADFVQKDQGNGPEDKVVNLKFRHVLSKIEFLFKTDTDLGVPVWVQEVSVSEVNTTSTLTVSQVEGVTTPSWATPTVPQKFVDDYVNATDETPLPTSIIPKEDTSYEIVEAENAMYLGDEAKPFTTWLVMPQDINTEEVDLKVDVVYVMGDRQFLASFDLGTTELTEWAPNQYVKYTITLTPNLISFNPEVEPWTPTGADGTETEDTPTEENRGN